MAYKQILKLASILSILTYAVSSNTQSIIELETLIAEASDESVQIDLMNELSGKYYLEDIDKSYSIAKKTYAKATEINYQKGIAHALNKMALYHTAVGERLKSIELDERSMAIAKTIQEENLIIRILNNLGYAHYNMGLNDKALEYYFEALSFIEDTDKDRPHVVVLENITNVFKNLGDEEKANIYHNKVGEVARNSSDSSIHYIPDLHLAEKEISLKQFELASQHFSAALSKAYSALNKAYILRRFAFSDTEQRNYSKAKSKIEEAIKLYQTSVDVAKLIDAKIEIIKLQNEMSQYSEALTNASELLQNYKDEITGESDLLEIHTAVAFANQRLGNAKKANEHFAICLSLKDSIFNQQKIKFINELDVKYNLKKKEEENTFLKSEQEKGVLIAKQQNKIVLFTTLLLVLLSIISFLLYLANKQKNRFNKALEDQVNIKTTELQNSNLKLKESNIELERFAYITSHDLKQPLRNISSFSDLIERDINKSFSQDKILKYNSIVQSNALQMNNLVESILEFSREGTQKIYLKLVNTQELLLDVKSLLFSDIKEKKAIVNISSLIPKIHADETQLLLVFKNLILNGIKFNQCAAPQVDISYKKENRYHHFYVKDNGIGIDQKHKEYIFEMFNRLHNQNEYEGSGLGLAFCKKIINKMGGKIWLEDMDNGSCFCFTIPIMNIEA